MTAGDNPGHVSQNAATKHRSFRERLTTWPVTPSADRSSIEQDLKAITATAPDLTELLHDEKVSNLISGTMAGSPYLRSLMQRAPQRLTACLTSAPETLLADRIAATTTETDVAETNADVMRSLRNLKNDAALLTALADLGGVWPVMTVTQALSQVADTALKCAIRFLFREAIKRGEWQPASDDPAPETTSGYFVLAVGKYGAHELNYSSDIDLIVLFDPAQCSLRSGLEQKPFFVRITRDLIALLEERTADGYVFRTDLRLRPDAGATPIAMSTDAAAYYYETFGQNWERAALIKARAVAGDIRSGARFIDELTPFVWRRSLDYGAIADIHALKRQMHTFRGFGEISTLGQNIKLGPGGIREIEFFAQTQQLIAGGRQRNIRERRTLDALNALAIHGWIEPNTQKELASAYLFLRRIEHRLQMVDDEQTHNLPSDEKRFTSLSQFCGYETEAEFSNDLLACLRSVQSHYADLFADELNGQDNETSFVFSGATDDPATVETLSNLGYARPSQVLALVRAWHHGRARAVSTARARELLTDVQTQLILSFAKTPDPDRTLTTFDTFLANLPAGVQLFSLIKANPALLHLLASIMGSAPRLARAISRQRRLLDAVIDPAAFAFQPDEEVLTEEIRAELNRAKHLEDRLDRARIIGSEQAFIIGIKILSGELDADYAGRAYGAIAEAQISGLLEAVEDDMKAAHGSIQGGAAAVVAMGKLGGREMTASSDLDLIVIYDFDEGCQQSDGEKPLAPSQYYSRLTQRLISALSAPTSEGTLYEVDMRLRPSGNQGPVAARLSTFKSYQAKEAWTWEHLALTRARVVAGPERLTNEINQAIHTTLAAPRDRQKVAADVFDMRKRIEGEKGAHDLWDLKQVRGGFVDIEFIAQYLQLVSANQAPQVLDQNTIAALNKLAEAGVLTAKAAAHLQQTARMLHNLNQVLRLCLDEPFAPETAPEGLKALLAKSVNLPDFTTLEASLRETLSETAALFAELVA